MAENSLTKVMLVDDHTVLRDCLRSLLHERTGIEVVAEAGDAPTAVELARETEPDVVVIDIMMGGTDGIDATEQIAENRPSTKVIGLSGYVTRAFVTRMLMAGASGYVSKRQGHEEVVRAIRSVTAGYFYLCPEACSIVARDYVREGQQRANTLTEREREIVRLLADGKSSKHIASVLKLHTKTVDAYRRQIAQKIGTESLAALVKYAVRSGLTVV